MKMIFVVMLNLSLISILDSVESHKKNITNNLIKSEQDLHMLLAK